MVVTGKGRVGTGFEIAGGYNGVKQEMKLKAYDFQNRHLNFLFWGMGTSGAGM